MEVTVWGDLLFFVNFCMDFQCLFLTARLLHRPFSVWRCALASAFGGAYAVAALFLTATGWSALLADLGVGFLMCLAAYLGKDLKIHRILTPFGVYFMVSMAVGGVMSAMTVLLSHLSLPAVTEGEVSSGLFFFLALAGGAATLWWGRTSRRRAGVARALLRVKMAGREATFACAVDTGNLLTDPVSGRPVVILGERAVAAILSPALQAAVASGDPTAQATLPPPLARRVRLLPAATVTGRRLLLAVAPDAAFLDAGGGERPVSLLLAAAAEGGSLGDCDALLPAALINE